MAFELPLLQYAADALEPFISRQTVEFHYGKHHRAYVDNLNKLIQGTPFEQATLEDIVKKAEGSIFNNGAQVWNHTFYWHCLKPGGSKPSERLTGTLIAAFGSFDEFKQKFSQAAATLFGSGWAWLVKLPDGKVEIVQESNAGNPIRRGATPLLTCDVWEHAYYLDKQNRRADYIADFWQMVDWEGVESRLFES